MSGYKPRFQSPLELQAALESSATFDENKDNYQGFLKTMQAGFMQENLLSNLLVRPRLNIDEGFNPYEGDHLKGYEDFADEFSDVRSTTDMEIVKERIDRERRNMETLSAAGFTGMFAGFAAGTLSPENLVIPLGFARARNAATLASIAKGSQAIAKSASVSKRIFMGATEAAASVGFAEAALAQTQELRSDDQSLFAVAASSLLGGITSGMGAKLSRKLTPEVRAQLEKRLGYELEKGNPEQIVHNEALGLIEERLSGAKPPPGAPLAPDSPTPSGSSFTLEGMNSAEWRAFESNVFDRIVERAPEMSELYGPKKLLKLVATVVRTPKTRTAFSRFEVSRRASDSMTRSNLATGASHAGDAKLSVEAQVEEWDLPLVEARFNAKKSWHTYKKNWKASDPAAKPMDFEEFRRAAGRSFSNGFEYVGDDTIAKPYVEEAARAFDSLAQRVETDMIDMGFLPPSPDLKGTSKKHFRRYYDHNAIVELSGTDQSLANVVEEWFQRPESDFVGSAREARDLAEAIEFDLTGRDSSAPTELHDLVPVSGSTMERVFTMPDEVLQPFLETDIEVVFSRLVNSMAPRIELARAHRVGAYRIADNVKSSISGMRNKYKNATTGSQLEMNILAQRAHDTEVYRVLRSARKASTRELSDKYLKLSDEKFSLMRKLQGNSTPEATAKMQKRLETVDEEILELRRDAKSQQQNQANDYGAVGESKPLAKAISEKDIEVKLPAEGDSFGNDLEEVFQSIEKDIQSTLSVEAREAESMLAITRALAGEAKEQMDAEKVIRKKNKIKRLWQRDLDDLRWMRQRLLGMNGLTIDKRNAFNKAVDIVRNASFMSFSGGFAISSTADVGKLIQEHGLKRVMAGFNAMAAQYDWDELAKSKNLAGLLRAAELYSDSRRTMELWGFADARGDTPLDEGLRRLRDTTGKVTLQDPWNAFTTGIAAILGEDMLIDLARRHVGGETLSKGDLNLLRKFRITDDQLKTYVKLYNGQFGTSVRGMKRLRIDRLTASGDPKLAEAARIWRAAIGAQAHMSPAKPSIGSFPRLFDNSQIGAILGMFRRFGYQASQETLMTGLQRADLATLNGIIAMTGMGTLITLLNTAFNAGNKGQSAGEAVKEALADPGSLLLDSIDRGGSLGILGDFHNIAQRNTGLGLYNLVGARGPARFEGRNAFSSISPMAGYVQDLYTATGLAARLDFNPQFISASRDLAPWQTLFYMRWLLDPLERAAKEKAK